MECHAHSKHIIGTANLKCWKQEKYIAETVIHPLTWFPYLALFLLLLILIGLKTKKPTVKANCVKQ